LRSPPGWPDSWIHWIHVACKARAAPFSHRGLDCCLWLSQVHGEVASEILRLQVHAALPF
jgi:hypothetical protein